ncbi:glycosyltransferase family 1 protein [Patescibacteria group bacterium]|nr:MAG: glycosyltransferase family 1 protein [Patescibacteria group bacterium]
MSKNNMPNSATPERVALDLRPLLDREPGGVGAYTRSLFAALEELPEIECYPVITGSSLGSIEPGEFPNLRRLPLPNPLLNVLIKFSGLPRLDRLARVRHYLLPNWNFLGLARQSKLTLVVHDLSFERNIKWFSQRQRLWHRAVNPRRLVERADRVIAVSEWTKRDLLELYGTPAEKISVIYPVPDRPPVDLPFPVVLPERFILFLGAVEERKNPLSLLRAFEQIAARHPETHLIIAGRFGYGGERVAAAAAASPYVSRIRLTGYVPLSVRHALYRQAAVFVYPSFYEGFGIPLVEAMHAGAPVVTGNRSAMPEVVGDAGILADPLDINQIALALDEVLSNSSFAAALAAKGKERAALFPASMAPALGKLFVGES